MGSYKLERIKSSVKRYILKLQPDVQIKIYKAIEKILDSPREHQEKSGGIKHLKKGKYFCTWESKDINNLRIIYRLNDEKRSIKITLITPHLDKQR